jgi:hypothetical protein
VEPQGGIEVESLYPNRFDDWFGVASKLVPDRSVQDEPPPVAVVVQMMFANHSFAIATVNRSSAPIL